MRIPEYELAAATGRELPHQLGSPLQRTEDRLGNECERACALHVSQIVTQHDLDTRHGDERWGLGFLAGHTASVAGALPLRGPQD